MTFKSIHFFWTALAVITIAFTFSLFAQKPEVVYDKDIQVVDTVVPPEELKEKIVAEVKHEELKGPDYTIRVGLGGSRKPIPKIISVTTRARASEWLAIAGSPSYAEDWERLGTKYKIDYTLPLCIAWADSHLGRALKSKNNIGNIGNNDRGDVKHFETLEEGIEAIFWSLAHGKYMSGHTTIGTLSGEGRKLARLSGCNEEKDYRKKCYATSMVVWSSNVTNCMSVIHNKQIDEGYSFRF